MQNIPPASRGSRRTTAWLVLLIVLFGLGGAVIDGFALTGIGWPAAWMVGMLAAILSLVGIGVYLNRRRSLPVLQKIHEYTGWALLVLLLAGYGMAARGSLDGRMLSFALNLMYAAVATLVYVRLHNLPAMAV